MSQHETLRKPCPACGGELEREVSGQVANPRPEITCRKCGTVWPSYRHMIRAQVAAGAKNKKVTMEAIQTRLGMVKAGVRTGRNLAGGVRAVSTLLGRIASEVRQYEGHDSAARIGESIEGIVDQVILATEHIDDAAKGKTPEVYEGRVGEAAERPVPDQEPDEEGQAP